MQEKMRTKNLVIGEKQYQIRKMPARTACWIAMQILTKMLPGMVENKLQGFNLPGNRSELSEQEFYNIQNHCLAVCSRYEKVGNADVPQPVLMASGAWAFPDLDADAATVLALTAQSLIFNVSSFFEGDALKSLIGELTDPSLPNASS